MATTVVPLEEFAQRIVQRQSELEALRRQLEDRKAQLAQLIRQQQELRAQLTQVEKDIHEVTHGRVPGQGATTVPTPVAKPVASVPVAKPAVAPTAKGSRPKSLAQMLVNLVEKADKPVTATQLADALTRRKFQTTSKNFPRMIQARLDELVREGALKRVEGRQGVIPAGSADGAKKTAPTMAPPAKGSARTAPMTRSAAKTQPAGRSGQPPLRVILTNILQKSRQPLEGGELTKQALAAGYHSQSKDFGNVVWVMLGKMDNVERVPGLGYRLKKQ